MPNDEGSLKDLLLHTVMKYNVTVWHPLGKKYDDKAGTSREQSEDDPPLANPFQADEERIVLCKAFRRLKHKTQVFWAPRNDQFRTRLTHTIEVAQTASQIGSLLGLNNHLIAAIALGHDVGHPPFGHAGERALDACIEQYVKEKGPGHPEYERIKNYKFKHHEWSLKVLQVHEERPYSGWPPQVGLNLTKSVRDGIQDPSLENTTSLEAQVVGIADDLTWINHDIEDFERVDLDVPESLLDTVRRLGPTRAHRVARALHDIVKHSLQDGQHICMSEDLKQAVLAVKDAFHKVYFTHPHWVRHEEGARVVIASLVRFYLESDYNEIRNVIRRLVRLEATQGVTDTEITFLDRWVKHGEPRLIATVEQVAKMTDTFSLDLYRYIYSPETLDYYF